MTGQGWRVQPTWPQPSRAVVVDAWETLAVPPPNADLSRVDLVVELVTRGGRLYRLLQGEPMCGRPVTPAGWVPIAVVHVAACQSSVLHCHIADALREPGRLPCSMSEPTA